MKPVLVALLSAALPLMAASAPDKNSYSLARPTPTDLLRELSTDRPDVTESPFTVDAGHVQLEMDFANFTRSQLDGTRAKTWSVAPFNVRLGVFNNFEAGLFVSPYVRQAQTSRGEARATRSGFGAVTLRTKLNFFGNDGGESALGLIADVTVPTAARGLGNDKVEGDIRLPITLELAGGWDLGAMTVAEFRHRETGGYLVAWTNTATFGHDLAKDLSGYAELTSTVGDGAHVATLDVGLAWKLSRNTQLDCGAKFGLTRSSDDLLLFSGISQRF